MQESFINEISNKRLFIKLYIYQLTLSKFHCYSIQIRLVNDRKETENDAQNASVEHTQNKKF